MRKEESEGNRTSTVRLHSAGLQLGSTERDRRYDKETVVGRSLPGGIRWCDHGGTRSWSCGPHGNSCQLSRSLSINTGRERVSL